MWRDVSRVIAGGSIVIAALLGAGCGKPPPGGVVAYDQGAPELAMSGVDATTGVWQSAPWGGEGSGVTWIAYPGRVQVQVEHGLGRVPTGVLVYLSFLENGDDPALAAGDLARVTQIDETHVTIWNDTNAGYYARIVVF